MEPIKITENVYWVGALDYSVRDFHGYKTSDGSTYNAFLIIDEKITLIDVVKKEFMPELLSRIQKVIDPTKIDQVVSNHAELDHSGSLPEVMSIIGPDKPIYASKMGEKTLRAHFNGAALNIKTVASGDSLSLGQMDLEFLETRMIHWPDSMFSFCPQNGVLFSQDAFGMHMATSRRFDDEIGRNVWSYEALKYFANILTPYAAPIGQLLDTVTKSGLLSKIKVICPDHGLIWRQNINEIVSLYDQWVKQEPTRKAVVVYDSMWKSTEYMARQLADCLAGHDVLVKLMSMKTNHRSDVVTEICNAGAVLVGSPTLNNDIYPTLAEVMCYMRGLKFKNKIGGAFGSYGWSGEAPKLVHNSLADMKYNMVMPEVRLPWVPTESDMGPIKDLAAAVAKALPSAVVPPSFGL
ncbi:MAG: FprA family A-type flavoprotein [Candidatus Adiutrix sp.]